MDKQQSIAYIKYGNQKRKTKWDEFLAIMDEAIQWDEWTALVEPFYPSGRRGRPPRGVETMLRMYLLANWFNLSDEGMEDPFVCTLGRGRTPASACHSLARYRRESGRSPTSSQFVKPPSAEAPLISTGSGPRRAGGGLCHGQDDRWNTEYRARHDRLFDV